MKLFHDEAKRIQFQMHFVWEDMLSTYQRTNYKNMQALLFKQLERTNQSEITSSQT